jgi:hypothetical protein
LQAVQIVVQRGIFDFGFAMYRIGYRRLLGFARFKVIPFALARQLLLARQHLPHDLRRQPRIDQVEIVPLFHVAGGVADLQAHRVGIRDLPRPGDMRLAQAVHVAAFQEPRDFRADLSGNFFDFGPMSDVPRDLFWNMRPRAINAAHFAHVEQMRHIEGCDSGVRIRRPEPANRRERHAPSEIPADILPIKDLSLMRHQQRRFGSSLAHVNVRAQFGDEFRRQRGHAIALFAVPGW